MADYNPEKAGVDGSIPSLATAVTARSRHANLGNVLRMCPKTGHFFRLWYKMLTICRKWLFRNSKQNVSRSWNRCARRKSLSESRDLENR